MSNSVPETLLEPFSRLVAERMGLDFPPERWPDLARGISSVARELGFLDPDACARWLMSSPLTDSRLEVLARHLTVGETYFLRDKAVFMFFAEQILPELISLRRQGEHRLRIWSAGCATGEEPYSIAILLRQALPEMETWNVTILATDINPGFLRKASRGIYSDWSFRDLPAGFRSRYFTKAMDGHFQILPLFQRMVHFAVLNLAEDSYPSLWSNTNAMDVIFCRNVLMYFTPAQAQKAVCNLHRSLLEGGWLIVSASEASPALFAGFQTVHVPGAMFYRKDDAAAIRPQALPTPGREGLSLSLEIPVQPQLAADELLAKSEEWPIRAVPDGAVPGLGETAAALETGGDGSGERTAGVGAPSPHEPPNPAAMAILARTQANQGRLPEALEWCEKAVAADKLNAAHHYLRAVILLESGAKAEAVKCLRQTLYLDPRFVLAHMTLGTEARREGRIAESARHFENALSLLRAFRPEEPVPDADGITARRMEQIIEATLRSEGAR